MHATTLELPTTVEDGYEAVKGLIFDQVYKFARRYGGDLDDLVGEAHVAFMRGHTALTKTGRRDGYSTEIRRWVWFELFDAMRVRLERERRVKFSSTTDQEDAFAAPAKGRGFDPEDFVAGLTADAAAAANLVLCPPPEVAKVATAKGGTPRNYKSTVRAYLRGQGWETARINEAFEEITGALV